MKIIFSVIVSFFISLNPLPMIFCDMSTNTDCNETMIAEDMCHEDTSNDNEVMNCCNHNIDIYGLEQNSGKSFVVFIIETTNPNVLKNKSINHFIFRNTLLPNESPPLDKVLFLC